MAWTESKKFILSLDPSKIDADLTDFPIAVRIAADSGINSKDVTAIFDELGANSKKIAIFHGGDQTTGTECYVEIEKWDDTGEEAVLHVKVPSVSSEGATTLVLYYDSAHADNTAYVGDTGSTPAQNVWDADFVSVYHLAQDPTGGTGAIKDSTGNSLNGTANNMEAGDLVDGKCGKALAFDGSDECVSVPYDAKQAPTAAISVEVLAYRTDWTETSNNEKLASKTEVGGYNIERNQTAGQTHFSLKRNNAYGHAGFANSLLSAGWHYFLGKYDGRYADLLADDGSISGQDDAGGSYPIQYGYSNALQIAAEAGQGGSPTGNYFAGQECELRISKIARSDAWGKATYYSLFDDLVAFSDPWDETKRYQVAIDASKIGSDLNAFPIFLNITASAGINTFDLTPIFDEVGTNKKKIAVFTAPGQAGGQQCFVEIERWDSTGEQAALHIRAPKAESAKDTILYIYYDSGHEDNTGFVGDIGETPARNVWDDDFIQVYHMAQDPTSTQPALKDSTKNVQDQTTYNMESGDLIDGLKSGKAYDFDGTNERTVKSDDEINSVTGALTAEAIFRPDIASFGYNKGIYCKFWGDGSNHRSWTINIKYAGETYGKFQMVVSPDGTGTNQVSVPGTTDLEADTWYYGAGIFKPSTYVKTILDDVKEGELTTGVPSQCFDSNTGCRIGVHWGEGSNEHFNGKVGEARFSKTDRSEDWVKATYYSLFDNLIRFSGPWDETKKYKLTIDHTKVDADLTDFPIHVLISASSGITSEDLTQIFDEIGANKKKIAIFTSPGQESGEQCFVEIETWDSTGEKASLHVRVPLTDDTVDTELYLYYLATQEDNTSFIGDTGETPAQLVWDANFKAVYHLAQDPTGGAGAIKNSTSLSRDATAFNMEAGDLVDAEPGKGLSFDGVDEQVTGGDYDDPGTGPLTAEAAFKRNDTGTGAQAIIGKGNQLSTHEGWALYMEGGNLYARCNGDGGTGERAAQYTTAPNETTNNHHVALVLDRSLEEILGFLDGSGGWTDDATWGNDITSFDIDTAQELSLAALRNYPSSTTAWANIKISEVRISLARRSDAWIKATYYTLFDSIITFVFETANQSPNTPSITSITELYNTSCTLHSSAFSDPDEGDTHAASQWQVDLQTGDFSSPVHDSGETTTDLTSHAVTGLTKLTDYKARVRHKDDSGEPATEWSAWSTPYNFSTKDDWSGILFDPDPADGQKQIKDGTPVKCDVTDNWYTFANQDISIQIEGTPYDYQDPEVSYEAITDGKRIVWSPPQEYEYGRGDLVDCRVDAKNSNEDESYIEWDFYGWLFISIREAETFWGFREWSKRAAELQLIFRYAIVAEAELHLFFKQLSGVDAKGKPFEVFFRVIEIPALLKGAAEPTLLVCEIKRLMTSGDANIAEVTRITGEADANIYGAYLVLGQGQANIQAFQFYVMPAGSADIQVEFISQAEGSGNVAEPTRIGGEGDALIFKMHVGAWIRINALPAQVKQALEDAGVIIDA